MTDLPAPLPPPPLALNTFPPEGWTAHPDAAGQYYCGNEVLWEADLRTRYGIAEASDHAASPALMRMLEDTTGVTREMPASGTFEMPEDAGDALPTGDEPVKIPVSPQWDSMVHNATQRETMVWKREAELGPVEVSASDRMLFVKQGFNNREIEFDIPIGPEGDTITIKVRSISNKALAALYQSLAIDRKAGMFGEGDDFDAGFFATRMQILSMMLQVVEAGPEFAAWVTPEELVALSQTEIANKLSAAATEWGGQLSGPRHALLVIAVRIFEHKLSICKEALANGDFSDPAS